MRWSAEKAIFWGGLICGILDFASAVIAWHSRGATIRSVGQSIAAGLIGHADAFDSVRRTALLGIFLHFVIAFGAAATYYLASRFLRILTDHPVVCGLIYGELVFLFMNMIVLPLSALHRDPLAWTSFSPWPVLITGPLGHPFLVGLPIALATARFAPFTPPALQVKRAAG
jgi:hypothetical protein